jgi:class 3 adenylate cyclase
MMRGAKQAWSILMTSGIRWFLALGVVIMTWITLSPKWILRSVIGRDFVHGNEQVVQSLEDVPYRVRYVENGAEVPDCPGSACPLDPKMNPASLPLERSIIGLLPTVVREDAWRGVMYQRWDVKVPAFVRNAGDSIVFDYLGISGKSWRFFVNGVMIANGVGGMNLPAIHFSSPGKAGDLLVIGFEIQVGRALAPGLVTLSQPFLAIPGVSEKFRLAYRGMDGVAILPVAMSYAFIATLAAFACFFTPFYREILAFAVFVLISNWRFLLRNGFSTMPSGLNVDFLAYDGMLLCVAHAALWSFWGFYFRVRSWIKWVPMMVYAALVPVCFLAGRFGYGLDVLMGLFKTRDIQTACVHAYGMTLAIGTWRQIKGVSWARFRRAMIVLVTFLCGVLSITALSRQYFTGAGVFQEMLADYPLYELLVNKNLHVFVGVMALAIALEWSVIVRDRQKILQKFGMVVDPRLVNNIIRGRQGESRRLDQVVILFADLRAFTAMCESYDPDKVTGALNEYLDIVMNAVGKHGGVIDKIVGDAVMAVWGVPTAANDDGLNAVRAAVDIRAGMVNLNRERAHRGDFAMAIGIGIHKGPAIFGAIGNGVRVDHTVIGPSINVASRLQNLTKSYGCDILLSRELLVSVSSAVIAEDLGLAQIRGVSRRINVAKILGVLDAKGQMQIGHPALEDVLHGVGPGLVTNIAPHVGEVVYASMETGTDAHGIASQPSKVQPSKVQASKVQASKVS